MGALSQSDMALWHAWKAATKVVRDRVVEEVGAATGLSEPDFGVLTRVVELGDGTLRQNELAASMGWHRTRLSHHLSRMEQRRLVTRAPADDGVAVTVTAAGRDLVAVARPLHADAVRRHLAALIPGEDRARFQAVLARIADGAGEDPPGMPEGLLTAGHPSPGGRRPGPAASRPGRPAAR